MDLVVEDGSRVGTIYFLMDEANVAKEGDAALDELWLGRRVGSAGGASSSSPARIPGLTAISRACSANMCARKSGFPSPRRSAGSPRFAASNLRIRDRGTLREGGIRRCRGLRSGPDRRSRDLRQTAGLCDRHAGRLRQRRPGAEGRRAYRRDARPGRARTGIPAVRVNRPQAGAGSIAI